MYFEFAFIGDSGYGLSFHNNHPFFTYDRDDAFQCALLCKGGWWYNNCAHVNLNGEYITPGTVHHIRGGEGGILYRNFDVSRSLKKAQMMFRRVL